jgi:hypothetical protein
MDKVKIYRFLNEVKPFFLLKEKPNNVIKTHNVVEFKKVVDGGSGLEYYIFDDQQNVGGGDIKNKVHAIEAIIYSF